MLRRAAMIRAGDPASFGSIVLVFSLGLAPRRTASQALKTLLKVCRRKVGQLALSSTMKRRGKAQQSARIRLAWDFAGTACGPCWPAPHNVGSVVPIALLHRIACEVLPHILAHPEDWEAAALLVHAGHVEARMQLVPCPWGGLPKPAFVVSEITASARALLVPRL